MQLTLDVDPHIDNHTQERKQKAQGHERKPPSRIITRKRQDQQHHRSADVGCHGVQVRLHGIIPQPRHDLWQKQLHALQRHPQTDFNGQDQPTGPLPEDLETLSQVELLIHHGAGIDLHPVVGQLFLFGREELGRRGRLRQVEECEDGEEDGATAFDDEQVAPLGNGVALDLEDAECQQATEGRSDGLSGVEDGEAAGEFTATIEAKLTRQSAWIFRRSREGRKNGRGLIVNHQREKGTLRHAQEPAQRHDAGEILRRRDQQGTRAKGKHHQRQDSIRSILLAQDAQERGGEHVGHEEDAEDGVVLRALQSQRLLQPMGLGVPEVGLVEAVEEIHDGQNREDAQVEFPRQGALGGRTDGCESVAIGGGNDRLAAVTDLNGFTIFGA